MSNYQAYVQGEKPRHKKALREAVEQRPHVVAFEDTSYVDNKGVVTLDELEDGAVIVGPDAHTQRQWYARLVDGKVV